MYDVVTFGEAMIRLSPIHFQRLEQARILDMNVAGAELNVAVGVTRFGLKSAWVSKLPKNPLGYAIRDRAREFGVDCSHVIWSDQGRVGIYFIDFGAAPRPTEVLYDRSGSAVSMVRRGEIDWKGIFKDARHFHMSGITPALSDSAAEVTQEALVAAKASGCTVSYDLNYRSKLWTPEEAKRVQEPLMAYVDILITNEGDPRLIFGFEVESPEKLAEALAKAYPFKIVAMTLKETRGPWTSRWSSIAYQEGVVIRDRHYEVGVVDRVGAGDSFSAGLISGWLSTRDVAMALQWGNAFAALKHTFPGDFNWCTRDEVEALLRGPRPKISR